MFLVLACHGKGRYTPVYVIRTAVIGQSFVIQSVKIMIEAIAAIFMVAVTWFLLNAVFGS